MNGKSGENNVEIKSGQQVCVVFFFFFSSPYRWSCILQWQRKKREKGRRLFWGRWLREEAEQEGRARRVARYHLPKGQIEETPHANIWSIYLPAKCLPFSFDDEISPPSNVTEIQLKYVSLCFLFKYKEKKE